MHHKFGLFINLDYAHKSDSECALIWQQIRDKMSANGFTFEKRAFVLNSEISSEELSSKVRALLNEILTQQPQLYSYIADCYILNFDDCTDLTLPDTSDSIDVEDISLEELDALGITYHLPLSKAK